MAQHALGLRAQGEASLQELIDKNAHDGALQIAEVFACRGDADRAFEWLERACLQRDAGLAQIRSWPLLRSLHGDSRWQPFLAKLGLIQHDGKSA